MENKNLQQNEVNPMGIADVKNTITENVPEPVGKEDKQSEAEMDENLEYYTDIAGAQVEADEDKQQNQMEKNIEVSTGDYKIKACKKLRDEQEKAKNKQFAEPVINYLIRRCEEDNGLGQDVMQEHKTWDKCFDYIYDKARKQANNARSTAVRDDAVYEWAEDYYHKDDKAEEEKKAREDAERKKKEEERKKKLEKKKSEKLSEKEEKTEKNIMPEAKPKKSLKEMDGQMDFFSMMGM